MENLQLYASPSLRWGLLLQDYQSATVEFSVKVGEELGIPREFGGGDRYVVATIVFPKETGKPPVVGWKAVTPAPTRRGGAGGVQHMSDWYAVLCTKALGRALKRAGYPDSLEDLRALVLLRMQNRNIPTAGELSEGEMLRQLEKAAASADAVSPDDIDMIVEPGDIDGAEDATEIDDAEMADNFDERPFTEDQDPVPEDMLTYLRERLAKIGSDAKHVLAWARENNINPANPRTVGEAQAVLGFIDSLAGEPDSDVVERAKSLDGSDLVAFKGFCASIGVAYEQVLKNFAQLDQKVKRAVIIWLGDRGV